MHRQSLFELEEGFFLFCIFHLFFIEKLMYLYNDYKTFEAAIIHVSD